MRKILLFIIITSGWLIIGNQLSAAGLSVTPDKLFIQTAAKKSNNQDLYLKNISQGPALYNLYTDELADQINIQPNFIRLEPDEIQKVRVTATPDKAGLYLTNLVILTQDLNRRQFNAAAGAKIPLEIKVDPSASYFQNNFLLIIVIISSTIVIIDAIVIMRRRKLPWWQNLKRTIKFFRH